MNQLYINGCFRGSNKAMTCKELAGNTGMQSVYISRLMSRLKTKKAAYFIRLKPKKGSREYRYQLSKLGEKWYYQYLKRFYLGFDLNCVRAQPRKIEGHAGSYARITKEQMQGLMKITVDKKLLIKYYMAPTHEGREELKKIKAAKKAAENNMKT
jgi:hypothetical protein